LKLRTYISSIRKKVSTAYIWASFLPGRMGQVFPLLLASPKEADQSIDTEP
jgi:hypothetical protein